ncbi:ran-specific GTPase-activating protein isoform X1 [Hydra vulgaris]|uniref:Ran-specific GTPase-activating protein n=1 Tax=Hydra vulgaris TaxID=6087 RepID=T2MG70_HYDVU|nr:ran-specific GTPase-activating protein [Hydra vulgaris]
MSEEQIPVVVGSPEREIHVTPLVTLEKVKICALEEDEVEHFKIRCKLYRFHMDDEEGATWKERGVGELKIMKHNTKEAYRIIMRRDKTLKICANHSMSASMVISPHNNSENALVWNTPSDFTDGEHKPETLCIRFRKPENTILFKTKFEECVESLKRAQSNSSDSIVNGISTLKVNGEKDENDDVKNADKDVNNVDNQIKILSLNEETNKSDNEK